MQMGTITQTIETERYAYHPDGARYESVVPCVMAKYPIRIIQRVDLYEDGDYVHGHIDMRLGISPILALDGSTHTGIPKRLELYDAEDLKKLSQYFPLEELEEIQQLERMLRKQVVNYPNS